MQAPACGSGKGLISEKLFIHIKVTFYDYLCISIRITFCGFIDRKTNYFLLFSYLNSDPNIQQMSFLLSEKVQGRTTGFYVPTDFES